MSLAIVDLGYGNIGSIEIAFARLGVTPLRTACPDRLAAADRIVLPGAGAAGFAMERLRQARLDLVLSGFQRPLLGICLGMQLLFDWSEEDNTDCLGIIAGKVRKLEPAPGRPVPHMGWSRLSLAAETLGLSSGDYAYFAHGFACDSGPASFAEVDYGRAVPAAVRQGNVIGCQFHPERSHLTGARFLKAFLAL